MFDISFAQMLINLNRDLPYLWRLVTAATFLTGLIFAIMAIYRFREYALTFSSNSPGDVRKPLITLFVAIVLLYWPTFFRATMETVFNVGTPVPYSYPSEDSDYTQLISALGNIVQLIGFIAFIRGWVLLARIGQQGAGPGTFGKALMHIIGGLFAVNIFGTWEILKSIMTTTS